VRVLSDARSAPNRAITRDIASLARTPLGHRPGWRQDFGKRQPVVSVRYKKDGSVALLNDVLEHNARWVEARLRPLTKVPQKKVVIFTCMDTRLVEFLEQAMGLGRGDAQVIKNAGNTLVDPGGGVVRSLVVAIYALGCEEVSSLDIPTAAWPKLTR